MIVVQINLGLFIVILSITKLFRVLCMGLRTAAGKLVFSCFFYIPENLGNVKEKPTRKACFSCEIKCLDLRIYLILLGSIFFEVNKVSNAIS